MYLRAAIFLLVFQTSTAFVALDAAAAERRPNVIVILTDDQGVSDVAALGSTDMRTPHTDRLFARGVTFSNCYANCPVCSPSRAALLTGCYPDRVGVPGVVRTYETGNWGYFDPEAPTLADTLSDAGYQTAIIGKWHLGLESPNLPNERGFDFFHGFLGDMMDDYYHHRRHGNNYMRLNRETIDPKGHATDLFSDWSVDYLKQRSQDQQPFFLFLTYNAPHDPVQPPPDWLAKVKQREPNISDRRAKLVAFIEHLDDGIGRVMKALDETGLADDTLVIFTSDNGGKLSDGANNGDWRGGKQDMYEGGLRVPGCAVWPGKIEPGSKSEHAVISMDIYATLCELAGVEASGIDGKSFLPTLLGKPQPKSDRTLYWVRREGNRRYMGLTTNALRHGDWKLVRNRVDGPFELFNLKDDPRETTDLADKQPAQFNRLAEKFRQQVQAAGSVPWQRPRK